MVDSTILQTPEARSAPPSLRQAQATATVLLTPETLQAVLAYGQPPGEALATARVAGIMAAKRCSELIPLCHHQLLDGVEVEFVAQDDPPGLRVIASASCRGKTGADMEALTAVAVAALTVYDMVKVIDRDAVITNLRVIAGGCGAPEKEGQVAVATVEE